MSSQRDDGFAAGLPIKARGGVGTPLHHFIQLYRIGKPALFGNSGNAQVGILQKQHRLAQAALTNIVCDGISQKAVGDIVKRTAGNVQCAANSFRGKLFGKVVVHKIRKPLCRAVALYMCDAFGDGCEQQRGYQIDKALYASVIIIQ